MSDDGADLGMTAEDGMKAALGDEEVNETAPRRSPEELLADMRADVGNTYSGVSNAMALAVLRLFEERPETKAWPAEVAGNFFWKEDREDLGGVEGEPLASTWSQEHPDEAVPFTSLEFRPVNDLDLYQAAKALATPEELELFEGCSGFQWGWAVNAAKYVVGEPSVPNPAIVEIHR